MSYCSWSKYMPLCCIMYESSKFHSDNHKVLIKAFMICWYVESWLVQVSDSKSTRENCWWQTKQHVNVATSHAWLKASVTMMMMMMMSLACLLIRLSSVYIDNIALFCILVITATNDSCKFKWLITVAVMARYYQVRRSRWTAECWKVNRRVTSR